ncbi:hypothetical protein LSH36_1249g00082 [Paralvinella palmiformis]|uniref:Uncharacterized protein n=1 Tax=Paralvinella palmiformis TaxID=53620 RepID=A0AAD9ITQ4_9ANNE|nr:hypothetical protein LSH36_1249g00082 [Paralvinella palmiformis]
MPTTSGIMNNFKMHLATFTKTNCMTSFEQNNNKSMITNNRIIIIQQLYTIVQRRTKQMKTSVTNKTEQTSERL